MSEKSKTRLDGAVGGATSGASGDGGDIEAAGCSASTSATGDGPNVDISLVKALIEEAFSQWLGAAGPPEKAHGGAIAGAGLGEYDPRAVAALCLPKSATSGKGLSDTVRPKTGGAGKPDGAAIAESGKDKLKPVEATPQDGKEAQKFSMGVTLPTVPARLVKRILAGEFVDMGELSQEALRAEFKRATDGEDPKPSKAKSFRPVANRDAWVSGFAQYAGVICRSHPEKAVALWGHLAVIMSCQNHSTTGWWRSYDTALRHSYSSMEEADFCLNQCLFTQAMVEGSETLQRPPHTPTQPGPVRAKRRRVQACFAWNDGRPCASHPCRFAHCCAKCGGDHARRFCTSGADVEERNLALCTRTN